MRTVKGWKKGCLITLLALVVLVVGTIGTVWFVHRPFHQPSFYAEVAVDLLVDGEAVRIERIVECKTVKISSSLAYAWGRRGATAYAPTVGAVGKRLKDGGAILMWTPYRCAREEIGNAEGAVTRRVFPNDPGYLPFLGWTPDADNFETLELYPDAAYFERPDARIKVLRAEVADAPEGAEANPPDAFEWFTDAMVPGESRTSGMAFWGFGALVIGPEAWKGRDPGFDALMASIDSPSPVPHESLSDGREAWRHAQDYFREKYGLQGSAPFLSAEIPEQTRIGSPVRQKKRLAMNPLDRQSEKRLARSPLVQDPVIANALVQSSDETGAINVARVPESGFLRLHRIRKELDRTPNWATWQFGSTRLVPDDKQPSTLLYDPETLEIYWLFSASYVGLVRKD